MTDLDAIVDALAERVAERVAAKLDRSAAPAKRLFTVEEAASYLGRSKHAVYQMKSQGKLHAVADGARVLFDRADLNHWIEMHKRDADGGFSRPRTRPKPVQSAHVPHSRLRKPTA